MTSTPHRVNPVGVTTELFLGMPAFPEAAVRELGNDVQRHNLRHATRTIRDKRAAAVAEVPEWEDLRLRAAGVKDHTLTHLDDYLVQLEEKLTAAGATVHWARDADEACSVVTELVQQTGTDEVVKVKSMATQEIGLNEALEAAGIAAWETDLAELIVQLGDDWPSHILVPAIHKGRKEIREIFQTRMAAVGRPAPDDLTDEPAALADAARLHLREKFLRAGVAISGANFAIAETGTLVVLESEGNGRMCLTLPETLISVVGIEKVLPNWSDLDVFMQLLPRSSTAERMNPYTSMWTGAADDDGPQDVHVVLVDNGRTAVLEAEDNREALRCIRCSACLNVCPVYEQVGGHAYGSVYPGPIGAVLTPALRGTASKLDQSLPFASSLCGACFDACPVRIDIPRMLVAMRTRVVDEKRGGIPTAEAASMRGGEWLLGKSSRLLHAQQGVTLAARVLRGRPIGSLPWPAPGPLRAWTAARDAPSPPRETFRQWWARTHGEGETS